VAVAVAALASVEAAPQRGSVASIGNGDINGFLGDRNLVMMQISCVKGTGPCNRLGNQLKQAIPEVLNNKCGRCTQTQSQNARKLINYIERNYPQDYQQITARYLRSG
ncbi:putative odorant-binding protein A10, partial [Thrips palmi]|uniref:Odorant-binding protein A10 n=1 Tax=Thrips palmi TaxID=161013 RepID=A0A6P8Z8X3_THRPL